MGVELLPFNSNVEFYPLNFNKLNGF